MNIEGSKLASVLQAGAPTEGRGQSLIDNGPSQGGFADALMGQMESLGEIKVQGELPGQQKVLVESQPMKPLIEHAEFLVPPRDQQFAMLAGSTSEREKLAGKVLDSQGEDPDWALSTATVLTSLPQNPQTEKVVEPLTHEINEKKSDESSLDTSLSETLALLHKPHQLGQGKDFNHTDSGPNEEVAVESNMPLSSTALVEEFRQKIGDTVAKAHAVRDSKAASHQGSENEAENSAPAFSVSNTLPPVPASAEEKINIPHAEKAGVSRSANETGHNNAPQSFIKPLFEEFKSNASGATEASEDVSPKSLAFGQIIKAHQELNENRSERSTLSENMDLGNAKSAASEADKSLPNEIMDIPQMKGPPVENRGEIPAMSKPLAHPDWNKELGERIVWMNSKDLSAAEIKLNPQHLGPISVRIEINNDQATIAFTAQHAAVRDALEASIPKLREMMSNQQINLTDVNISQNSSSDQQHQSSSRQSPRNFDGFAGMSGSEFETSEEADTRNITVGKGILNIYA
jgi:flagellar hook-length control protein FliK